MLLHHFCHAMRERVRDFEKYIREDMRENPDAYPTEDLSAAAWREQFEMFLEA